jgi:hypothetical protein
MYLPALISMLLDDELNRLETRKKMTGALSNGFAQSVLLLVRPFSDFGAQIAKKVWLYVKPF